MRFPAATAILAALLATPLMVLGLSSTASAACQAVSTPNNLQPSGVVPPGDVLITWTGSSAGAKYWVRIDASPNSWNGDCVYPNAGDACDSDVIGTKFSFHALPGKSYNYWIHEVNSCGWYSPAAFGSFQTSACTPTTCERLGLQCGTAQDGCGQELDCGTCSASLLPAVAVTPSTIANLYVNNQNTFNPEVTPFVQPQTAGTRLYELSTAWSWFCSAPSTSAGNFLAAKFPSSPLTFSAPNCKLVSRPSILDYLDSSGYWHFLPPASVVGVTPDYKRDYFGILGFRVVGGNIFTVAHGEHQNTRQKDDNGVYQYYQGTIFPEFDVHQCWSGYAEDGTYQKCWNSFASFASLLKNQAPNGQWTGAPFEDKGPVLWANPAHKNGSGQKVSGGYYHSQFFSDGNFLYVYTINPLPTRGGQCTVVGRAPVSGGGDPGTWKTYFNGNFSENAMPAGFKKENIANYYNVAGGRTTCILGDAANDAALWFHVAKVKGTPFFVAAEESSPYYSSWQMGLRISADLVNWSPLTILSTSGGGWGSGQFTYPTLYNKTSTSSTEVDANEFYVVGNHPDGGYGLRSMKVSFACPSMATSTPTNLAATVDPVTKKVTLNWDVSPNAAFYWIRADDANSTPSGWSGNCAAMYNGDFCSDGAVKPPLTFQGQSGHFYSIWMHSVNMCGQWSPATPYYYVAVP